MSYLITYDGNIGAVALAAANQAGVSISTSQAITGTRSIRVWANSRDSYAKFPFPGTPTTPAISVWVYLGDRAWDFDGYARVEFLLSSGEYVGVRFDGTNKTWDLYVDGTKVADGTISLTSQYLHNLRIYGTIANAGTMTVVVDGEESISYSGDTQPGTGDAVDFLRVFAEHAGLTSDSKIYLSSLSLNDGATDPGDRRASVLMPDGDDSIQWTPSSGGSNYEDVDEVPPDDDDYLETSTDGHKDLLTLEDFDDTAVASIAGVTKFIRAKKTTAATQSLYNGVDSNGTEDHTEHELLTDYAYYFHAMENNPDDAAAWEDADIDALKPLHEAVIP